MALDLSRLDALKLPEKEIEVSILGGDPVKLTITAYDDAVSLDIAGTAEAHPEESERRVRVLLLQQCAGLSEADAEKLVRFDAETAAKILSAVFDLRDEFVKARNELRDAAKKKPPEPPR